MRNMHRKQHVEPHIYWGFYRLTTVIVSFGQRQIIQKSKKIKNANCLFDLDLYVILTGQGKPFNLKWSDGPAMKGSKAVSVFNKI